MAALANIYHRIVDGPAGPPRPPGLMARGVAPLRPFANEDVYFYVKRIDNSGVVRQADPQAKSRVWKLIASASAASVLVIGILLPGAYGLLAGYQIQALKEEARQLKSQQGLLDLEEARLMTPERMEALAAKQHLEDPPEQSIVYLQPKAGTKDGSAVAQNRAPAPVSAAESKKR